MGKSKKLKIEDVFYANLNPHEMRRKLNHLIEKIAREKASTDALHGDGLFPISKDVNGKVEAGTGLQVVIKDYIGLIDGYQVYLDAARILNVNKTQTLAITKTGEFYVGLALDGDAMSTYPEEDDQDEVDAQTAIQGKYGKLPKHGSAIPVEIDVSEVTDNGGVLEVEGKIILAKMDVPAETTQITAAMIDNSVKDYLLDIDVLRRDVLAKINEVRAELYQEIVDAVDALKDEIADGDQAVLDELNAKINTINSNIENIETELETLKTNVAGLSSYVSTVIAPRLDELSEELDQAVIDLTKLVVDGDALLDEKIEENLGKIGLLQTEVESPVTGLLDRVTELEGQPSVPPDLVETLQDHEERITNLELYGGGSGPTFVNCLIEDGDLDGSSTYDVDVEGKFTLPINTAAQYPLQDTFDTDGAPDTDKWDILAGTPSQASGELVLKDLDVIESDIDIDNFNLSFDLIPTASSASNTSALHVFFRASNILVNGTYYMLAFGFNSPSVGSHQIYLLKYENGSRVSTLQKSLGITPQAGVAIDVDVSMIDGHIIISANDSVKFDVNEPDMSGSPTIANGSIGFRARYRTIHIDNVNVQDPDVGVVYESSGTILTNQLESTSPILKAFLQGSVDVPADTNLQFELTLNGGTDWATVSLAELVDGTAAPWNSVGDDYRVKVTLTTADTSKTPKISSLRAISQR